MDIFSKKQRSAIMARVGSKDTQPEIAVRKMLHHAGYRYRLHVGELPGCPDIVFSRRKKAIFIHGCFWHGHTCHRANLPKSNYDYWKGKQTRNAARDKQATLLLRRSGWKVLVIWECEIKHAEKLHLRLTRFLKDG
jgi:DNA mismatch endonuclease (patch repair protein)